MMLTNGNPVPTEEEIVARMRAIENSEDDFFGFQYSDLANWLSWDNLKPFLKDEVQNDPEREEEHKAELNPLTRDRMVAKMLDYMEFAWGKACNMRGLSAHRSIEHYVIWTWLAGDALLSAEVYHMGNGDCYEYYGKPILRYVAEFYGWDWKQWDDDIWGNSEDDYDNGRFIMADQYDPAPCIQSVRLKVHTG